MVNNDAVIELDVRTLLSESGTYIIPVYQRNYAWGEAQIRQLIRDVIDSIPSNGAMDKKYYIGTLIVDENTTNAHEIYETIDGQQRLTTLNILAMVLKNHPEFAEIDTTWFNKLNLDFTNRALSANALKDIFNDSINPNHEYHNSIIDAYNLCITILKNELKESNVSLEKFTSYLFNYVSILRVSVPPQTDLNHYFEIMNNRGEQLEKHEVLKAKLLDVFNLVNDEKQKSIYNHLFHLIWEASSNMEKYVQYGFKVKDRHELFGHEYWDTFSAVDFDELTELISIESDSEKLNETDNEPSESLSIDEIIEKRKIEGLTGSKKDDNPDRFYPIINFSNFLLHVLRIQTKEDIPLDDKKLISVFENILSKKNEEERLQFTKDFGYNLLKAKYLFDKYIIKRDTSTHQEEWSLLKMKCYKRKKDTYNANYLNSFADEKQNRKLIQLLSMFHVSVPTLSYKHWLNAALNFVFTNPEVTAEVYVSYLEEMAKQFVYNRIIAQNPQEYYQMIYNPDKNAELKWTDNENTIDLHKLTFGAITNNLLFNYTDYLLWRREVENEDGDSKIISFKFTSRSSVEHYFPQNPLNEDVEKLDNRHLHSFGNLCLISHEKNSKLNNHLPQSKKDYYGKSASIDSIKQYLMMQETVKDWHIQEIEKHEDEIIELLKDNCATDYSWEVAKPSLARIWFNKYKREDKALLARTLMCFGQIDEYVGWSWGMGRWSFYEWERIEAEEENNTLSEFEKYIEEHNPETLNDIIEQQLRSNTDIRKDSYRYVFITRPQLLKYCEQGNFGWGDDGKRILLLSNSRADKAASCDMYCYTLKLFLKEKYDCKTNCNRERLKVPLMEKDNILTLKIKGNETVAYLRIWNHEGALCYDIDPLNLHGNSKIIRNLTNSGWGYNDSNRLYYQEKTYLYELSEDVEDNIIEAEKNLIQILSYLQE